MIEFLGWVVFLVIVVLALAALGIAALGRRAGRNFSDELEHMRRAFGTPRSKAAGVSNDATKAELYEAAKDAEIPGRSAMSKNELKSALDDDQP